MPADKETIFEEWLDKALISGSVPEKQSCHPASAQGTPVSESKFEEWLDQALISGSVKQS